jgi:hypothetical protein
MRNNLPIAALLVLALAVPVFGQPAPLESMPSWTTFEQGVVSTGMVWRDCNNDGVIDVFYSNGNDIVQATNMIYLSGFPQGLPRSANWYSSNGAYSGHCAVGDVNDDGFPDFVVANYLGSSFGVPNRSNLYLNQGYLPDATPAWNTPDSIFSFSCALGDFDLDGDLDIVFATGEAYYNDFQPDIMYINDNGTFSDTAVWRSLAATAAYDVVWGDVDNDGDLDLAFTYENAPTALFYNEAGVLETAPTWEAATSESGNTLLFGDVNGDSWLDLVVAYNNQLGGSGRFRVYYNDGAGALNSTYGWQSSTGGYGSAISLYDYDNDGDDDLAAGRWFSDLMVYENLGDSFTSAPVWTSGIEMVAEELAWVDVDGFDVMDYADTLTPPEPRKLFYTGHDPLYAMDSVVVDGARLEYSGFCYDLVSGWVALAEAPITDVVLYYRYSDRNDLAVANWDTVNMVFANAIGPKVDFYADTTFGPVPLAVQFSDSSEDVTGWLWDFGDGETSEVQNPLHEYQQPGMHTVTLTVDKLQGQFAGARPGMISAYADTLRVENARGKEGRSARVYVYARNNLPLSKIVIPFTWAGPMNMIYDSFSTAGLRTEYLGRQSHHYDIFNRRATISLATSSTGYQPYLSPGDDPVVSLYFTIPQGPASDSNDIAIISYVAGSPEFITYEGEYAPETVTGSLRATCCLGRTGNVDCDPAEIVDIGDVSIYIRNLFITMLPFCCIAEADVDMSGIVDIGDLTIVIQSLFVTLEPLLECP